MWHHMNNIDGGGVAGCMILFNGKRKQHGKDQDSWQIELAKRDLDMGNGPKSIYLCLKIKLEYYKSLGDWIII